MSITGMGYGLSSPYGMYSSTGQPDASLGNLNPAAAYSAPAVSNPMSGLYDATGGSGLSGNDGIMGMVMQIMSLMLSMLSMLLGGLGGNSPANPQSLLATGGGTDSPSTAGIADPTGGAAPTPTPAPSPAPTPSPAPSGTAGTDGANGTPDNSPPPSGDVGSWISQAQQALAASGVPMDKMNTQDIATIIQHESSGDPSAINLTDGNAQAGHPSIGLMQTIQPTFDDNKLPGHDNIRNPVDNIIAGVRYAVKTYGSVSNVPGVVNVKNGQGYVGY